MVELAQEEGKSAVKYSSLMALMFESSAARSDEQLKIPTKETVSSLSK